MPEKSEFDKALGELYDLTEWENAEAAPSRAPRTAAGNGTALH